MLRVEDESGAYVNLAAGLLVFVVSCMWAYLRCRLRRCIKVMSMVGGHNLYLCFGNVFDGKIIRSKDKNRIVVIPVNRCFDMVADDRLIIKKSLHGQGVQEACLWKAVTPDELQKEVNDYLQDAGLPYKKVAFTKKKRGGCKRYAPGTIVPVTLYKDCTFYFLALSWLRPDFRSTMDILSFDKVLKKLVDFIDVHAYGRPVVLPVLGSGFTRLGKTEDQLLHMLVNKLYVYGDTIQSDIYIVASESLREKLNLGRYL